MSDALQTLINARAVAVQYRDGREEIVHVRELPISALPGYQAALDDEPRCAELYAGQEKGWADTLSNASLEVVIKAGEELNMPFFVAWLRRKIARAAELQVQLGEAVAKRTGVAASPSAISAPNCASSQG
jgi:hypothetical protein